MSGHRPFSDLKKGWSHERLAANEARKTKLMAEMVSLEQLREGFGISQEELANVMEVQPPAISKLVRRFDMKVSTLGDLIAAMSRSLKDLLHILEKLDAASAGFRSLTESIDTTTPAGGLMMQMVGSFAEFERAMIRERTSAGLAEVRAAGRGGGRRPKLSPAQRAEVVHTVLTGRKSAAEMARLFRVSEATVCRMVAVARMVETNRASAQGDIES